jgi:hypothetical protein
MRARQRHYNPGRAGMGVVFDARFISGISAGSDVGTWSDRSGNANDATEATTKPTYEVNRQGGAPAVVFVKANSDKLTCGSAVYSGNNNKLIIAAYKGTSTGTYSDAVCGQSGDPTTGKWFALQARTEFVTGDPYIAGFAADTQNNKSTPDNAWKIGTGAYNGTTLFTRKNGVEIDSVGRTLNTNSSAFRLAHDVFVSTPQEYFGGDIGVAMGGQITYSLPLIKRLEHGVAYSFKIACS